jgi:diaminohydroxyphosphoribosylaminopyrimidine deaminase/5-amino-6-(5-phosphoribosylamino)uracil reductase
MKQTHEFYMQKCFDLAKKALGNTTPNPYVGSVIIKDDKIIAEGFHKKSGMPHAELDAIQNATTNLEGSTLYCNLEPCCHTNKKTPPCAQRIVSEGIKKVVISNLDPNPDVAGVGVKILQDAGIEVVTGIMEEEGNKLNEVFFTHITKKRPFIHLKWAQTLDGKLATMSFDSKWITNELSRNNAHKERSLYDAIIVGSNTVNRDNPNLTIRLNDQISCKTRVIISPKGEIDKSCNLFTDEFSDKTIIITSPDVTNIYPVKHLTSSVKDGVFEQDQLMELLYKNNINSIYVEGGPKLINSFLDKNLFDRVSIYIAPKLLGAGISATTDMQSAKISESLSFTGGVWSPFGQDILFESSRNLCLQD